MRLVPSFSSVRLRSFRHRIVSSVISGSLLAQSVGVNPVQGQNFLPYCQQTAQEIAQKETARKAAQSGKTEDVERYKAIVAKHANQLKECRRQNWLKTQGLWIRLYPCDTSSGALEDVLDKIVDRGYNQIYVETFFNGMVLLPQSDNGTAWQSVINHRGGENIDLLADVIQKGRERGLTVYAWMFALNFGFPYANQPSKQISLIRNGRGQTSLNANTIGGLSTELGKLNSNEAFIDPYSIPAKQDYYQMMQKVLKRKPDGILFDYIRYPRGQGTASISANIRDLWVYGDYSRRALIDRGINEKGRELIKRYIERGSISPQDVAAVDLLFPREGSPMWQGRRPSADENRRSMGQRHAVLRADIWRLAVAHAMQGVVDFLSAATYPAQQQGIPSGAVFFPGGNQIAGQTGYDSRLQPWDRFSGNIQFHPMSYAVCGRADCILNEVRRVVKMAPSGAQIKPVLAGIWQQSLGNRPPLEVQMETIRQNVPQISEISHFAYSWQEPKSDRDRKFCQPRKF
jgi:hypothetical protein